MEIALWRHSVCGGDDPLFKWVVVVVIVVVVVVDF